MDLTAARAAVQRSVSRLASLYGDVVFDEWALIVVQGGSATIAAYEGPRSEDFRRTFLADVQALLAQLVGRPLPVGDFVFALEAEGTAFDACVRVGERGYLLLNHTGRTMEEIRSAPGWKPAQRAFAELAEAFQQDPLV